VVSESRVTWATSVPISVFLGPSVLELGQMYATDRQTQTDVRQTDVRQQYRLIIMFVTEYCRYDYMPVRHKVEHNQNSEMTLVKK